MLPGTLTGIRNLRPRKIQPESPSNPEPQHPLSRVLPLAWLKSLKT